MDAFDADAVIYAADPVHPLGRRVRALFEDAPPGEAAGVGSVLLIPEVLIRPTRRGERSEVSVLAALISRLDLRPVDGATANFAVALGASYGLRTPDAMHLATAVAAGADRFITNNRSDFPRSITEVDVTYPGDFDDIDDNG